MSSDELLSTQEKPYGKELDWMPACAHAQEVERYIDEKVTTREDLSMGCVVGPAIPWAFLSALILWTTWLFTPRLAEEWSTCPADFKEANVPHYDMRIWLVFMPIIACCLAIEWKCLTYVLPPMIIKIRKDMRMFTLPFIEFEITARQWIFYHFGMSFVNHLDIITNGIFLAKVLKLRNCENHALIEEVWRATLQQSAVPNFARVEFEYWVRTVWICMVLQIVYGLLMSVPAGFPQQAFHVYYTNQWKDDLYRRTSTPELGNLISRFARNLSSAWECEDRNGNKLGGDYDVITKDLSEESFPIHVLRHETLCAHINYALGVDYKVGDDEQWGGQLTLTYRTVLFTRQNHFGAMQNMADATRMSTLTAKTMVFMKNKIETKKQACEDSGKEYQYGHAELNAVRDVLISAVSRFFLVGCLENALMMNVQITLLAIDTFLSTNGKEGSTYQQIFSIAMSLLVALKKFAEACSVVKYSYSMLKTFTSRFDDMPTYQREVDRRKCYLWSATIFLGFTVCCFGLLLLYVLAKLVAVRYCEDSLLNLTGCARLPDSDEWTRKS